MRIILAFTLLFSMQGFAANSSGCQRLLGDEEVIVAELAEQLRRAYAKNRDDRTSSDNNPLMKEVEASIAALENLIPDVRQKINAQLNKPIITAKKKEEPIKKPKAENLEDAFEFHHVEIPDGEPLVAEEWHSYLPSVESTGKKYRWIDANSKIVSFVLPKGRHKTASDFVIERTPREVFHLRGRYIVDTADTGPLRLLELNDKFMGGAKVIGEFSSLHENGIYNMQPNHAKLHKVSHDSFTTTLDLFNPTKIHLWQWQISGEVKETFRFDAKSFAEVEAFKDMQTKEHELMMTPVMVQLTEDTCVMKGSTTLVLWQKQGADINAKPVSYYNYSEDIRGTSVRQMIKVDDKSFITIHMYGHVAYWKIVESNNSLPKFELVSTMGGRDLKVQNNKNGRLGHWADGRSSEIINAAALIAPNLLLTAGNDGRMILWKFALDGDQEIIETFPNGDISEHRLEVLNSNMGRFDDLKQIQAFRWRYDERGLWIESRDKNGNTLWAPMLVDLENEL